MRKQVQFDIHVLLSRQKYFSTEFLRFTLILEYEI